MTAIVMALLIAIGSITDGSEEPDAVVDRSAPVAEEAATAPVPAPTEPSAAVPAATAAAETVQTPAVKPRSTTRRAGSAAAALAALRVKGRAPNTGYDRDLFGQAWTDVDRNGCDQRNDVLARDLDVTSYKPGTGNCVVLAGTLEDRYSGTTIQFTRGQDTSMAVQIDHVVALADAWQTGAQKWGPARLETFANDPLVLMAADGPLNSQKGASDAASWLPPNKSFRCAYVARQVAIKTKYDLWVKPAEKDAIARVLGSCPDQKLPRAGKVAVPNDKAATRPATTPPPATSAPAPEDNSGSITYENCDAVRAAGKAPILQGQPGYSRKLDRDGDGQGCDT